MSELYSAYAAGRLSPAYALMLETQAALRADIAVDVACSEAISGILLEEESPDLMSPNAFETALKSIGNEAESNKAEAEASVPTSSGTTELDALPEPLRTRALRAHSHTGWRRLTSGVSRLDLSETAAVKAHLYRIRPGSAVPTHSHYGDELTLVLQGGFSDHNGSFGPGEISRQTPRDTHTPVADDDGVCLALAVSEGGMRFKGMLGLVQKIVGR